MAAQIPDRNTSKYCGQYAGTFDAQRVIEIFMDSQRIALSSKNPETAGDRFALAIEAYHQVMSMGLPPDARASVQSTMEVLVNAFPVQVVANEALGLREKARKLKTRRKQLDLLNRAREILERGLAENPGNGLLRSSAEELRAEIGQLEAAVDQPGR
jgi:hypothetical protein